MDAFDAATMIADNLRTILYENIPLKLFTDYAQLFDALTLVKRTTERRLVIDIAGTCEAYRKFEIEVVGIVRGYRNPVDGI